MYINTALLVEYYFFDTIEDMFFLFNHFGVTNSQLSTIPQNNGSIRKTVLLASVACQLKQKKAPTLLCGRGWRRKLLFEEVAAQVVLSSFL